MPPPDERAAGFISLIGVVAFIYPLAGGQAIFCRDPDANTLLFTEDSSLMPIAEADDGPMVPWTRLW